MTNNSGSKWIAFWGARIFGRQTNTFESLTRPHVDALWRTAFRMCGNRETADELTQEACLNAYRSFSRFQQGTNYRAWIFRILTNLCLDHARRLKRSPIVSQGLDVDFLDQGPRAPSEQGPETQLVRTEVRNAVLQAMNGLKPEIRLVVSLALLEDRTYQEISEIVGCPVGTVRSRLSRGRRQLRTDLQGHMPNRVVVLRGSNDG
jgi:RNA polymerase sigma-70 factor, ECF subfamily